MSETTDSDRDWREWAYLDAENWPDAIPWTGPKRRYGPYPWSRPDHDSFGVDEYPHFHVDAASVGDTYLGDVCPWCGVPVRRDEEVVVKSGDRGTFWDINELDNPVPAYHPVCWGEREALIHGTENTQLTDYA